MTNAPTPPNEPPSQQGQPIPPTPQGQPGAMPSFDAAQVQDAFKKADRLDLTLIGVGVVSLIFSFFDFYKVSVKASGLSASATGSAWHGFFGWFGVLLMLIGAVIVAATVLGIALPFPLPVTLAGLFGVAAICEILAIFIVPGDTSGASGLGISVDKGHGFSFWIVLILSLVGAAITIPRYRRAAA